MCGERPDDIAFGDDPVDRSTVTTHHQRTHAVIAQQAPSRRASDESGAIVATASPLTLKTLWTCIEFPFSGRPAASDALRVCPPPSATLVLS